MPGWFPTEGQVQELTLALGVATQPDWRIGLYTLNAHPDCTCTYADLTQPTDLSYAVQDIDPTQWDISNTNPCDATAAYEPVEFMFTDTVVILGWFIFTDDGTHQKLFCLDLLNGDDGVTIPTGGGSLTLTITLKTDSVSPG